MMRLPQIQLRKTRDIDLRHVPVVVPSLKDETERISHMKDLVNRLNLNIRFIEGVKCIPGFIGVSIAHIRAVSHDAIKPPFLLLENDVDTEQWFDPRVDIPDDADGLYLGISSCGVIKTRSRDSGRVRRIGYEHTAIFSPVSDDIVRVHNMTSAHALLFLTEAFKGAYIRARMHAMVDWFCPGDVAVADIQASFNVYAQRRPYFFSPMRFRARIQAA